MRVRGWSRVVLSSATKAGTWTGSRRSSGPSAPPIIQPAAARTGASPAASAIRTATGCRQPKLCSATRMRAPSAPTRAAAIRAVP